MAVGFKSWSVHLEANTTKSRGLHSTEVLASYPGSILSVPKNFSMLLLRFIDSTAWNSGQRL